VNQRDDDNGMEYARGGSDGGEEKSNNEIQLNKVTFTQNEYDMRPTPASYENEVNSKLVE
jgi:hypothetical protein